MNLLDRLIKLDRRIIFLLIFLAVGIPLIAPIGLPVEPSQPIESGYDFIEEMPPGSFVLVSYDYDPSARPELYPMGLAIIKHLMGRGIKVVTMALWPAGAKLAEEALNESVQYIKDTQGRELEYGRDYANLGFMAGNQIVIVSLGKSVSKTFPNDFYGTPIENINILNGMKNYSNIDLIVTISAGDPGVPYWVMYAGDAYDKPVIGGCTAVSAPQLYPYFANKQLVSLIGGLKGAAEYETLIKAPGKASKGMDSQSIAHLTIILLIIVGNITFFLDKQRLKRLKRRMK